MVDYAFDRDYHLCYCNNNNQKQQGDDALQRKETNHLAKRMGALLLSVARRGGEVSLSINRSTRKPSSLHRVFRFSTSTMTHSQNHHCMDLGSRRTRPAATQVANDYCNQHTNLLMRSFVLSLLIANTIAMATKVLVTGAGGKTGRIVLQKLLDRPGRGFEPTGVVRTETSKQNLVKELFVPSSNIQLIVADICDPAAMEQACQNMDALVICTSATPAPTGEMKDDRPVFGYPNGQPKQVDWIGQKNQIDAAKKAGVSQIVICSSMGG